MAGLDDYSMAAGFEPLLIDYLTESLEGAHAAPNSTCLLLACHGNPGRITRAGDPGEALMRKNYAALSAHFGGLGYDVHLAFQVA